MKDMSRWIIKQMFYLRPVSEEFPVALVYGINGPWPWHMTDSGLWMPGQKDGAGNHPGTDFDVPEGAPIIAMADGYISKAGWDYPQEPGRGYGLRIRQTVSLSRWSLTYGHLSDIFVKPGAMVLRGHGLAGPVERAKPQGRICTAIWKIPRVNSMNSHSIKTLSDLSKYGHSLDAGNRFVRTLFSTSAFAATGEEHG